MGGLKTAQSPDDIMRSFPVPSGWVFYGWIFPYVNEDLDGPFDTFDSLAAHAAAVKLNAGRGIWGLSRDFSRAHELSRQLWSPHCGGTIDLAYRIMYLSLPHSGTYFLWYGYREATPTELLLP